MKKSHRLDWQQIETVFLDMDGTLLDLHFDDYFWREHVPLRYAEKHHLPLETAKSVLRARYRESEGTLEWYCLDFWTRELGLDIPGLKEEIDSLIAVHPHVVEFLDAARVHGKRLVLVTNAHGQSLALKMRRTGLQSRLDRIVCAHNVGLPKEDVLFWHRLREVEEFNPQATLLVDDSLPVLRSAREFGIRFLVSVLQPNTRRPSRSVSEFPAIKDFSELQVGNFGQL